MINLSDTHAAELAAIKAAFEDLQKPESKTRGLPYALVGSPLNKTAAYMEMTPSATLVSQSGEVLTVRIPEMRNDKPSFANTHLKEGGRDFEWAKPALTQMATEYNQIRNSDAHPTFRQFFTRGGTIAITQGSEDLYSQHCLGKESEKLGFKESSLGQASFNPDNNTPIVTFNANHYGNPQHANAKIQRVEEGLLFKGSTMAHEIFHTGDQKEKSATFGRHADSPLFQTCLALDAALEGNSGLAKVALEQVSGSYPSVQHHMEAVARIGENHVANPDKDKFSPLLQGYVDNVYLPDASNRNHAREEHVASTTNLLAENRATEIFGEELGDIVISYTETHQSYIKDRHQLEETRTSMREGWKELKNYTDALPKQMKDGKQVPILDDYAVQETQRLRTETDAMHEKDGQVEQKFKQASLSVKERAPEIKQKMNQYLETFESKVENGIEKVRELAESKARVKEMNLSQNNPLFSENERTRLTALTRIIASGNVERFHAEVPADYDITAVVNKHDENVLHQLAQHTDHYDNPDKLAGLESMLGAVKSHVEANGKDWRAFLNTPDKFGETPIDSARDLDNESIALLLEKSDDQTHQQNRASQVKSAEPCILERCQTLNEQLTNVPARSSDEATMRPSSLPSELCKPIKINSVSPSRA